MGPFLEYLEFLAYFPCYHTYVLCLEYVVKNLSSVISNILDKFFKSSFEITSCLAYKPTWESLTF
jgi:hypothetical protein